MSDPTLSAFQELHATIDGLQVPTTYPTSITAQLLPCAVTFVGPVEATKFGRTTYVTQVFVAQIAQGVDPERMFQDATALLKRFRTLYRSLGQVGGFAIDKAASTSGRTGFGSPAGVLRPIRYAGSEYYGFEFQVPLLEVG